MFFTVYELCHADVIVTKWPNDLHRRRSKQCCAKTEGTKGLWLNDFSYVITFPSTWEDTKNQVVQIWKERMIFVASHCFDQRWAICLSFSLQESTIIQHKNFIIMIYFQNIHDQIQLCCNWFLAVVTGGCINDGPYCARATFAEHQLAVKRQN